MAQTSLEALGLLRQLIKEFKISLCKKSIPNAMRYSLGEYVMCQLVSIAGRIRCLNVRVNVDRKRAREHKPKRYPAIIASAEIDKIHEDFTILQEAIEVYCDDSRIRNAGKVLTLSAKTGAALAGWADYNYRPRSAM